MSRSLDNARPKLERPGALTVLFVSNDAGFPNGLAGAQRMRLVARFSGSRIPPSTKTSILRRLSSYTCSGRMTQQSATTSGQGRPVVQVNMAEQQLNVAERTRAASTEGRW